MTKELWHSNTSYLEMFGPRITPCAGVSIPSVPEQEKDGLGTHEGNPHTGRGTVRWSGPWMLGRQNAQVGRMAAPTAMGTAGSGQRERAEADKGAEG